MGSTVPGGQAALALVGVTLFVIYFVGILWNLIKPPFHFREFMSAFMFMMILWLGWTLRTWPTRGKSDGPLWTLALAWRDSVITLIYLGLKLVGLVELWDKVWNFVEPFFKGLSG